MVRTNQKARETRAEDDLLGADYHRAFQQIAYMDTQTGEWNELRLGQREEAEKLGAPGLEE